VVEVDGRFDPRRGLLGDDGAAQERRGLTDKECEESIVRIEKGIHSASNWSRYGMITRSSDLQLQASPHGEGRGRRPQDRQSGVRPEETNCKMPDPVPYIRKTVAHQAKMEKRKK